jgi:hypothetical protein
LTAVSKGRTHLVMVVTWREHVWTAAIIVFAAVMMLATL